jgi:hypothetical protein
MKKFKKLAAIVLALCMLMTVALGACGGGDTAPADSSGGSAQAQAPAAGGLDVSALSYAQDKITIEGLTDEPFELTVAEIAALDIVRDTVSGKKSSGEEVDVTVVGPYVSTLLAKYGEGKTQADFEQIRFASSDGYSIAVPSDILKTREIVLSVMNGDDPLAEDEIPLRSVVIGERSMYWARLVTHITFEGAATSTEVTSVVFLDKVLPLLDGVYNEEEGGEIVRTEDLLSAYGGLEFANSPGANVNFEAMDGLKKNETAANFLLGYIRRTGEESPQFCSPALPEGMNVDDIRYVRVGNILYLRSAEVYEEDMLKAENFEIITPDGKAVTVKGDAVKGLAAEAEIIKAA